VSVTPWHQANQLYLLAEVARLAGYLTGSIEDEATTSGAELAKTMDRPPALVELSTIFGLSDFERDVLLLCAGVELDGSFAELCAGADVPGTREPTFSLALARLPNAHWSAISVGGPLRRWRFIEVRSDAALTTSPLSVDERILDYIVGVDYADDRLAGVVFEPAEASPLVPSHNALARRIEALLSAAPTGGQTMVVELCGTETEALHEIAAAACQRAGMRLKVAHARRLPRGTDELETFIRLWEREAALTSTALLVDCTGELEVDREVDATVERIVGEVDGHVLIATDRRRRAPLRHPLYSVDVMRPTEAEQVDLWSESLGGAAEKLRPQIAALAAHFDLGARDIRSAVLEAGLSTAEASGASRRTSNTSLGRSLWQVCRTRARSDLATLARRLEPKSSWDDLVSTETTREALESIVLHVRHRSLVYRDWGFDERAGRGRGISALFAGPSGTGKTMAAEVLAAELELDLFSIDLSATVSKYIGETEKNLSKVFDSAEASGAILLFDEADALFGRRTEVKDAHDRYANIEVSYLLQRMETYRGIAILTSNMKEALDAAFLRRLSFIAEFPFPDHEMRVELWRRVFPDPTPTRDLDVELLAQLHLSGSSIRNIAVAAAFLAAANGGAVTMEHIRRAARLDYAKADRHITPAELEGWS
jgi:AAA+ superfamily predicted ATPase